MQGNHELKRSGRTAVVGVTVLTLALALVAVRAQQPAPGAKPAAPAPAPAAPATAKPAGPTKPLVPVAASSLVATPDKFIGEFVTLAASVDATLSKTVFSLDQDKTTSTGKDVLVIVGPMYGPVEPNTYVTAIGEVMKFDPAEIAKKVPNIALDLTPEVIEKYRGRPVIIATSFVNAAGLDVIKKPLPPLTEAELSYDKVMKGVGAANGAFRKAMEASNTELAKENTAILKKSFTETEAFWKTRGKTDAVAWAADARKIVEGIDVSVTAGKWDEVKASAGNLAKMCGSCHTAYRMTTDEGSFRIKVEGGQ